MSEALEQPVQTFSVRFAENLSDESPYARQVARQFGCEHTECEVAPDAMDVLPKLLRHHGEPFGDSSAIATYYISQVAAQRVKMVLAGDGGDESFAGYCTYGYAMQGNTPVHGYYRRGRHWLGGRLRQFGWLPVLTTRQESWYRLQSYVVDVERRGLWRPEFVPLVSETRAWFETEFFQTRQLDPCSHYQAFDIQHYLPDDILTKVDVASMANGLEVRVPLLDHKFMEMAARIPSSMKLHQFAIQNARPSFEAKYILKKAASRFFPDSFLHRPKQGFELPLCGWMRGPMAADLRARLEDASAPWNSFFQTHFISTMLDEHLAGRRDFSRQLWLLFVLDEWFRGIASRSRATDSPSARCSISV